MSLGAGVRADRVDVIMVKTSRILKRFLRVGKMYRAIIR
jgi:hypothetical protein